MLCVDEHEWQRSLSHAADQSTSRVERHQQRSIQTPAQLRFAEEALLLFVTVAKLRAREPRAGARGCRRTDARQPTGKANYVLFLELQRRMAAKAGVQLVVS
jgi:hypothetical protein